MTRREWWERRITRDLGPGRMFVTADVARFCCVKQRTVQRWVSTGRMLALASTEEDRYEARIPRDGLLEFLIRRTPPADYPNYVEV